MHNECMRDNSYTAIFKLITNIWIAQYTKLKNQQWQTNEKLIEV